MGKIMSSLKTLLRRTFFYKLRIALKGFSETIRLAEISRKNLKASPITYYVKMRKLRSLFVYHAGKDPSRFLLKLMNRKQYDKLGFTTCTVETYSRCNRKCVFCYNSDAYPEREHGTMSEETYMKLIDDLARLHFRGRLSPHFYGEPLLDTRLPELISYAKKRCPNCYILVSTNGDFLTEELLKKLALKSLPTATDDIESIISLEPPMIVE